MAKKLDLWGNYFKGVDTGKLDKAGNAIMDDTFNDKLSSGQAFSDIMQTTSASLNSFKSLSKSTDDRMDERGNLTHKASVGGTALSMGAEGFKYGGIWGGLGGLATGLGVGLADKNKQPTQDDLIAQGNEWQAGQDMLKISPESAVPQQQGMYGMNAPTQYITEAGLDVASGKDIEVEKDEVVLRKVGKSFRKVADFKGGKTHKQGGEPYKAQEGDIIFPGKQRGKVQRALKHRRWATIESMRHALPSDTGQETATDGVNGIAVDSAKYKGLTTGMQTFYQEVLKKFPNMVVTSGWRDSKGSRHKKGEALDFSSNDPEARKVYNWLWNSKEGLELLEKYDLGILDESLPSNLKKTGGTGQHYHIGMDTTINKAKKRLQMFSDNNVPFLSYEDVNNGKVLSNLQLGKIAEKGSLFHKDTPEFSMTSGGYFDPQKAVRDGKYRKSYGNGLDKFYQVKSPKIDLTSSVPMKRGTGNTYFDNLTPQDVSTSLYGMFRKEGFTAAQAEGAVVNLMHESGNFNSFTETGTNVNGQRGAGIAQWSGSRREAYENWMFDNNYRHDDLGGQFKFLMHELNTTHKSAKADLMKATTPLEASEAWISKFEIPSKTQGTYAEQAKSRLDAGRTKAPGLETTADGSNSAETSYSSGDYTKHTNYLSTRTRGTGSSTPSASDEPAGVNSMGLTRQQHEEQERSKKSMDPFYTEEAWTEATQQQVVDQYNKTQELNRQEEINKQMGLKNDPNKRGYWTVADGWVDADGNDLETFNSLHGGRKQRQIGEKQSLATIFSQGSGLNDGSMTSASYMAQQVGFTDDDLREQANGILDYFKSGDDEGDITWVPMDMMRSITKYRDALVTGQSLEGSLPNMLAEIVASVDEPQMKAIVEDMISKNIIDDKGMNFMYDVYANPEKFWTDKQKGGLGMDLASIVVNPKGILDGIKVAGKGTWAAGTGTVKATKGAYNWVKDPGKWKKLAVYMRKGKRYAFKVANNLVGGLKTQYKYSSADDLASMNAELDKASKAIVSSMKEAGASADEIKTYTNKIEAAKQSFKSATDFVSKLPKSISQQYTGVGLDELKSAKDGMLKLTGKTPEELYKMKPNDITKLVNSGVQKHVKNLETATQDVADGWDVYRQSAGELKSLKKQQAVLKANGPKNVAELEVLNNKIIQVEANLAKNIDDITDLSSVQGKYYDEISRLEGFQNSEEWGSNFRVVKSLEDGIARSIVNLEKVDNVVLDHKLSTAVDKNKKITKVLDGMYDAEGKLLKEGTNMSENMTNINRAVTQTTKQSKVLLKEAQVKQGLFTGAGGKKYKLEGVLEEHQKLAAKYPGMMRSIEQDIKLRSQLRNGTKTLPQIMQVLRQRGGEEHDDMTSWEDDIAAAEKVTVPVVDPENPGGDASKSTYKPGDGGDGDGDGGSGIDWENYDWLGDKDLKPGITIPKVDTTPVTPDEVVGTDVGQTIMDTIGNLADYAPAITNLVEGMQPADKIARRTITPEMLQYTDMSESQRSAVDTVFKGKMDDARNLSGGSVSSFRANAQAAYADKLRNLGQVNAGEAARADQVAAQNVASINQGKQVNSQINSQADQIDMKSEAATNSFFRQGISDIANISAVKRKDRTANKNQDRMLKMMEVGRDYDADGNYIGGKSGNTTSTTPTPTTTDGFSNEFIVEGVRLKTDLGMYETPNPKGSFMDSLPSISEGLATARTNIALEDEEKKVAAKNKRDAYETSMLNYYDNQ